MRETVLVGETRAEGKRLYEESGKCVMDIHMMHDVNLQPEVVPLRKARAALAQLCAVCDNLAAAASRPDVPVASHGTGGGGNRGRGYKPADAIATIARDQLSYESARLSADVLCDVSPDTKVKADKLRNPRQDHSPRRAEDCGPHARGYEELRPGPRL